MRKNVSSLKLDAKDYSHQESQTGFACVTCGEAFHKPILATVSSSGHAEKYYACPRCMVKIRDAEAQKRGGEKETLTLTEEAKKPKVVSEHSSKCDHFLGYLKKRSKDVPIPEECLTCDRMIECLLH